MKSKNQAITTNVLMGGSLEDPNWVVERNSANKRTKETIMQ